MKKLTQLRISQRRVESTSLEDAVLWTIEEFLLGSVQIKWSVTKQYLLFIDRRENIRAINFTRQWITLLKQMTDRTRLKCYLSIPVEFLKKEYR